jgi:hypothetical protein
MRFVVGVLACIGVGGISLALADPSTTPSTPSAPSAPTTPSAPTAAAPAAAPVVPAPVTPQAAPVTAASTTPALAAHAASAAAPAQDNKPAVIVQGTPEFDTMEKHFLAEGYKLEMRNGDKVFCRREEQLGSRLGGQKVCSTALQLMVTERQAQASVDKSMMQQHNPAGR